jgi:imidazolonepropionase-like amidohydrolase
VFAVPGFATHQELALLVAAGLTPFQALQAGTTTVAAFLGASGTQGTVARGKRADLVLVDANPLARVEHASRISGVMVRGRWIGGDEIASRLKALEVP